MVPHKEKGTAYVLLIVPSIFGIAGLHRFYIGQVGMGIVYLFTWGFLGIGLIIDLFTLSGMVDKYNLMQNALYGQQQSQPQPQNVVVNLSQNVAMDSGQPVYADQPAIQTPNQIAPPHHQQILDQQQQQQRLENPNHQNIQTQVKNASQSPDKFSISCPNCGLTYKNISAKYKGKTVSCKKCEQAITI